MSTFAITIWCSVDREQALRQAAHDVAIDLGVSSDAPGFLDPAVRSIEDCLHLLFDGHQAPQGTSISRLVVEPA